MTIWLLYRVVTFHLQRWWQLGMLLICRSPTLSMNIRIFFYLYDRIMCTQTGLYFYPKEFLKSDAREWKNTVPAWSKGGRRRKGKEGEGGGGRGGSNCWPDISSWVGYPSNCQPRSALTNTRRWSKSSANSVTAPPNSHVNKVLLTAHYELWWVSLLIPVSLTQTFRPTYSTMNNIHLMFSCLFIAFFSYIFFWYKTHFC